MTLSPFRRRRVRPIALFSIPEHGLAIHRAQVSRDTQARIYRETGGPRWFARVKAWWVSRKY